MGRLRRPRLQARRPQNNRHRPHPIRRYPRGMEHPKRCV